MKDFRYILTPYKGPRSRIQCPACGKPREFATYIDRDTGDVLAASVGKCNRELHCGYHFTPKQFFDQGGKAPDRPSDWVPKPTEPPKPIEALPASYLQLAASHYRRSNFYLYLVNLFGEPIAREACLRYLIGTSRFWKGATLFPQIDGQERFRQCKVMLYDPQSGKRVRAGATVEHWNLSTRAYRTVVTEQDCTRVFGKFLSDETRSLNLQQCYFGEHLIAEYPDKSIGIVESEKTAVLASVYYPEYNWLATGGTYGCRWSDYDVCKVLAGRRVFLFPDLGAFDKWSDRAKVMASQTKCQIHVSDLLERHATQKQRSEGWDLADYLVKRDGAAGVAINDTGYPVSWDCAGGRMVRS